MGLFSKAEMIEAILPFAINTPTEEDAEACMLDVEAYGRFGDCPTQYYYACVSIDSRIYDDCVDAITKLQDKRLKMTAKVKNGVIKNFKIDFQDLAQRLHQERLEKADIAGSLVSDHSVLAETRLEEDHKRA